MYNTDRSEIWTCKEFPSCLLHQNLFPTSSIHGERPSAEYARWRKESLESKFRLLIAANRSKSASILYRFGPFLALYRAAIISFHVLKLTIWQFFIHDINKRAVKFCETLVRLGPFYIKLGQVLSTRPDILPTVYCQELAKLQDQIPLFANNVAIRSIETQLGFEVSNFFADISPEPIAAASLGQVYKAHLHSGVLVAVKVQRPGMELSLTLDALLFHMIGGQLKRFAKACKDLLVAVNEMLVHFVNRDSLGLANDFLSLGFIPEGVDIQSVSDALQASFGDGTRQSQDFQGKINLLYDVMYEFNFSHPPDYALVIRALVSLEGTAKVLDPDFKVLESAYPFVVGRLLADPNPDMRKILRQLLIHNDGSIRWNRLECLIAAISEQASESSEETSNSEETFTNHLRWKSFDMHAVVTATEDLLLFILSEKGQRVHVFLLRDIIKAADTFLQEDVFGFILNNNAEARLAPQTVGQAMLKRMINGFKSFHQSVKLAWELWTPMFIRMVLKPDVYKFNVDIISALLTHFGHRFPETSWVCMSRLLHKLVKSQSSNNL